MERYEVHLGWAVRRAPCGGQVPHEVAASVDAGLPATVPGCIHDDLIAAGLLADPYLDDNEERQHWVGRTAWEYATVLPVVAGDHERIDLVCNGLDTFAELDLGGASLGRTANMHRTYRFDVTQHLQAGERDLSVRFSSPWDEASRLVQRIGDRHTVVPRSVHHMVRKMACNFGWDWGPMVVTSGIWRPIELQAWSTARLAQVRSHVQVHGGTGVIDVDIEVERTGPGAEAVLVARATVEGCHAEIALPPGQDHARIALRVPGVRIWQLHTRGEQPLYDLAITLRAADGAELDRSDRRVGFRTVELLTSPDETGSMFRFRVNGIDEYICGFNWIPDDPLITRIDAARSRERLEQAVAAGANLIRVWGGGVFESDAFYDACDELGLLVWQDFLFACAQYPEEEPLWSEVTAEARDNVVRLMHHPSLALWNGTNENLWGWEVWGWKHLTTSLTWGKGYYLDLLPRICAELDPGRPYWPGSPWSGSEALHPNHPDHGCNHSWEVWNFRDYTGYYDDVPRFVSEFGWQAPPTWRTLTSAVHDDPLTPTSPGVLHHQKADFGDRKLREGMRPFFGDAADTTDADLWHYLTQVNQVRAVSTGVSHWRSHWPLNAGSVLWQLNDCWPVTSWAALDMDLQGRATPKPLFFALQRLYAPQLLTIQERRHRRGARGDERGLLVVAVNNGSQEWVGRLRARLLDFHGEVATEWACDLSVAAGASAEVALPSAVSTPQHPQRQLLVAEYEGLRDLYFFATDAELAYPDPQLAVSAEGSTVRLHAAALARDVLLQADRLGGTPTAGLVTLLPGESVAIDVRDDGAWEQALVPPVLQHMGGALRR